MDGEFDLPVSFKGDELLFKAQLIQFGYSYRIEVDVNGVLVSFEKDDEGSWRALIQPEQVERNKIDRILLQSIVESLETVFSN